MNQEEYRNNIVAIAEHYGYESQARQLIEEMAELTQAINKAWRMGNDFDNLLVQKRNIKEEIADVTIMIEQIKYLLSISDTEIDQIIDQKLNRQLERIGADERKS